MFNLFDVVVSNMGRIVCLFVISIFDYWEKFVFFFFLCFVGSFLLFIVGFIGCGVFFGCFLIVFNFCFFWFVFLFVFCCMLLFIYLLFVGNEGER